MIEITASAKEILKALNVDADTATAQANPMRFAFRSTLMNLSNTEAELRTLGGQLTANINRVGQLLDNGGHLNPYGELQNTALRFEMAVSRRTELIETLKCLCAVHQDITAEPEISAEDQAAIADALDAGNWFAMGIQSGNAEFAMLRAAEQAGRTVEVELNPDRGVVVTLVDDDDTTTTTVEFPSRKVTRGQR